MNPSVLHSFPELDLDNNHVAKNFQWCAILINKPWPTLLATQVTEFHAYESTHPLAKNKLLKIDIATQNKLL